MADLATIHNHLEQGYFLAEDMEALGLKGNVSIAQMRSELATLFEPAKPSQAQLAADAAQAGIERAKASQAAAVAEAKAASDRAALVASVQAQQPDLKADFQKQQELQNVLERFNAALKADKHVQQTPQVLGPQDKKTP